MLNNKYIYIMHVRRSMGTSKEEKRLLLSDNNIARVVARKKPSVNNKKETL